MDPLIVTTVQPTSEMDTSHLTQLLTKAVLEKNYFIIAGVLLMIVVAIFKKFILPKISTDEKYKNLLPIITFALSIVTAFGAWILNPKLDLISLIVTSVGATFIASGSYESILKPFSKMAKKKKIKKEESIPRSEEKKDNVQ